MMRTHALHLKRNRFPADQESNLPIEGDRTCIALCGAGLSKATLGRGMHASLTTDKVPSLIRALALEA